VAGFALAGAAATFFFDVFFLFGGSWLRGSFSVPLLNSMT
jgi:hypothetical protein